MGAVLLAELWVLAGCGLVGAALGMAGLPVAPAVALGAALYIAWHARGMYRLYRALPDHAPVPESVGLWGAVFERLYETRREAQARTRHLGQILNRFEESAAALPDAAVVLGPDHTIAWCNDAAQHLLGLTLTRDRGQRIANVVRHPAFLDWLGTGAADGTVEMPGPADPDLTLLAQMVAYGQGRQLLVVRDITELRRLEQVRRDFVANASHELRTPLTVIYGFIETLHGERETLPSRWARPVDLMRAQTVRMQRIVDDMLVLARMEAPGRSAPAAETNVPLMLDQVRREALALSGARGHRIALAADAGLWLRGNESELRSVFSNLVFNAVQHTPDASAVDVTWSAANGGARLCVQDNGEGIPAEHIARLTERFYRVEGSRSRSRGGGTGLGLAIVKHALARHGAELEIDSPPGGGARFTAVFPADVIVHVPAGRAGRDQQRA